MKTDQKLMQSRHDSVSMPNGISPIEGVYGGTKKKKKSRKNTLTAKERAQLQKLKKKLNLPSLTKEIQGHLADDGEDVTNILPKIKKRGVKSKRTNKFPLYPETEVGDSVAAAPYRQHSINRVQNRDYPDLVKPSKKLRGKKGRGGKGRGRKGRFAPTVEE